VTGPVGESAEGDGTERDAMARAAAAVGQAIDRFRFNVAIAELMTFEGRLRGRTPSVEAKRLLVSLLAPFAPHVTEELWVGLGGAGSVHDHPWPGDGGSGPRPP
jgi:leucyl-tRNA synthetase